MIDDGGCAIDILCCFIGKEIYFRTRIFIPEQTEKRGCHCRITDGSRPLHDKYFPGIAYAQGTGGISNPAVLIIPSRRFEERVVQEGVCKQDDQVFCVKR